MFFSTDCLFHFFWKMRCRCLNSEGSDHLLGTVLPGCPSKEGQGDVHPSDRRNLPSILLKELRDPQHRNSNQGDMAGNPPERGNERDKERGRKRGSKIQREREAVRKCKKRESASLQHWFGIRYWVAVTIKGRENIVICCIYCTGLV